MHAGSFAAWAKNIAARPYGKVTVWLRAEGLPRSRRDRLQPRESRSDVVSQRSAPSRLSSARSRRHLGGLCAPPRIAPSARRVWKGRFSPGVHLPIDRCGVPGKGARGLWPGVRSCAAAPPPQIRCSAGTVADRRRGLPGTACAANGPGLTRKAVRSGRGTRSRKPGEVDRLPGRRFVHRCVRADLCARPP
jgi:hypothetical protein